MQGADEEMRPASTRPFDPQSPESLQLSGDLAVDPVHSTDNPMAEGER